MNSKILLFTDIHYGDTLINKGGKLGVNTFGDTRENLLSLKNEILKFNPSFSVNLGDVVTTKSKSLTIEKYNDFINIFDGIDLKNLVGNHELYYFNDDEIFEINKSFKRFCFEKDGILHIFINSNVIDKKYVFENDLFDWLSDKIFRKNISSIIYSHFPISNDLDNITYYHKNRPDACFLQNSTDFRDYLVGSNVKVFISGHTHFYFEKKINGINHITVPSFSEEKNDVLSCEYGILDLSTFSLEVKKL